MLGPDSCEIELVKRLQKLGIVSPLRARRLISEAIQTLRLDLSDLVVLTEAASRNYVYTPIIAALAGAKIVYGLTRDSRYGTIQEVKKATDLFARLCGVAEQMQIITQKTPDVIGQADIVTNLGFVRPINHAVVAIMKPTAVVPLMCEAWEARPGDVDLAACQARGILVMGTDESAPGLAVFEFSGPLCLHMLFEAGLEVYQNRIVIVSGDRFGDVLLTALSAAGADVRLISPAALAERKEVVAGCDALVLADYTYPGALIGKGTSLAGADLAALAPDAVVIQFAGGANVNDLARHGLRAVPSYSVDSFRMGRTFSALGPKPIIDLHTAGLKVGEAMARARLSGLSLEQAATHAMQYAASQEIPRDAMSGNLAG